MTSVDPGLLATAAKRVLDLETGRFIERHPLSRRRNEEARDGFLDGVPLHWMLDWPTPFPLVVQAAEGVRLTDIDGHELIDFCLGDTAAMFGHSPKPVAEAIARQASRGLSFMLPTEDAAVVGELLAARFGLPSWQVTTSASDANRFALRVARAVTGRRRIVVFDGCYHGAVDDTLVDVEDGATLARRSLMGQVVDTGATTTAVPFNDLPALAEALQGKDVACVIAEPVMTNCSMILPDPGFHAALRELTRAAGTLLLIDETHTISTGPAGYTGGHGLEPDIMVLGKPVAGGLPAAVWGLSADVTRRLREVTEGRGTGHSGIGTTLAGNALQLAALRACLEQVMTADTYAVMERHARAIEAGLARQIAQRRLPWHVARVGARLELVFRPEPLRNAADARAASVPDLERAIHLGMLNRGYLLTPFHDMILVSPATTAADVEGFLDAFADLLDSLLGPAVR
ncbi:MAG: aspartate aminotransferase family protein [Geminicoccaceae bacterium]